MHRCTWCACFIEACERSELHEALKVIYGQLRLAHVHTSSLRCATGLRRYCTIGFHACARAEWIFASTDEQ